MKFKLLTLSIIMLFAFCGLQANSVTKDNAAKVAVNFYYQAVNTEHPVALNSVKITDTYTVAENGITYYYIFNIENGGFVIVSAEDFMHPILGYSFEKNYSDVNPSPEFTWWMSGYKDQIRYAIGHNLTADIKTQELWNEYSSTKPYIASKTDVTVGPLILTRWNQPAPYNELCPADAACGHVLVGCVAVAMGQLINYYKFPLQGSGSHCYSSYYGYLCSTYSDSTYKWNEMPNQLIGSCIPLASFLYQCGIAVNMQYGCDASGAYSTTVPGALTGYFNFDYGTQLLNRAGYSQAEWENLIQPCLNQKIPIYYSGQGPSGGHAFVCDGYKVVGTTTTYHFNWGWAGQADGYFDINNLNPGGSTFNSYQQIIINAIPRGGYGYPFNCSGLKTYTALNGVFEDGSGHLDYQPNLNCSWLINPSNPSGTDHISLKFDLFEVTDASDIITIYNGENASAPVLATFKGGTPPTIGTAINSTSDKVFVTFTTNGTTNGGGWHISYSAVSMVHCSSTVTVTNNNYTFNDGSGATYDYNNNSMCKWKINPANATFVKLKFNQLETELDKDKIMIYKDFSATAGNLIGTYSGTTIPDTITSTTGKMYLVFTTDGSRTYPGWTVTYISDGTTGITENDVVNNISVFPNPAENNVKINFTVNTLQNVQLTIVDVVGNNVYSEIMNNFIGNYDKSIDISTFAKGLYIVNIKTDNGTFNQKLVIK